VLSDACSEFFVALAQSAEELAEQAHWYSSPDTLIPYGQEIDALRRASMRVAKDPYDLEASVELLRLAALITRFYDTHPDEPEVEAREEEMLALAKLLSEGKSDNQDVAALA
jgi:hypothetical protein